MAYADVIIDAYAAGVKAASHDVKWDGEKTNDPLNGTSASGLTVESVLRDFAVQIEAAVAEAMAQKPGALEFTAEKRALEDAVIDSWYNGYDVYAPLH